MQLHLACIDYVGDFAEEACNQIALMNEARSFCELRLHYIDLSLLVNAVDLANVKRERLLCFTTIDHHSLVVGLHTSHWLSCNEVWVDHKKRFPDLAADRPASCLVILVTSEDLGTAGIQHVDQESIVATSAFLIRARHHVNKTIVHDNCAGVCDSDRQVLHREPVIGKGVIGFAMTRSLPIAYAS